MNFEKLLFIILFLSLPAMCEHYFVSLDGDDNNTGTVKKPFKSIKKGVEILTAGDTLTIKSGRYREYKLELKESGTVDKPIIIKAENIGEVSLFGFREPDMIDGGGRGFTIKKSYITIDGLHFENYSTAILIRNSRYVTIQNSSFKNNGDSAIVIWEANNIRVNSSKFISEIPINGWKYPKYPNAIQDYAVSVYHSAEIVVENNYIYGAHNQSLSFKENCHNSVFRQNIIEGVLYTGIYLGQNKRRDGRKLSTNLRAEYNIIRATDGYRVKSPIRIDNVKNAYVHHNYIEGFDQTNNTGGINIFNEALGKIKIYDNIIAFAINNRNSVGIYRDNKVSNKTIIEIEHNTFYNISKDFSKKLIKNGSYFRQNIAQSYLGKYYNDARFKENYQGDLKKEFKSGIPQQKPISKGKQSYSFKEYYKELTEKFILKEDSSINDKGYRFVSPLNN